MNELNFQTSRKTYTVNGGNEISFDPADVAFVGRIYDLVEKAQDMQEPMDPEHPEGVFQVAAERDAKMRAAINEAFGEPVCEKVFGNVNVYSPAGGAPLWMNFIMAVIDEIDAASETEREKSPRLTAYMQKYEKKYGKRVKK